MKEKCLVKILRYNPNGTKSAVVAGIKVEICSHNNHPDKYRDSRVPGYREKRWPEGCINCCFRLCDCEVDKLSICCGLTLNDRGFFSEVSPLGKCERYRKGKSLFP
jgi:hypothetical protein